MKKQFHTKDGIEFREPTAQEQAWLDKEEEEDLRALKAKLARVV